MRYIESDDHQSMRGDKLEEAIINDKAKGLVPFWVSYCLNLLTFILYFINIHFLIMTFVIYIL